MKIIINSNVHYKKPVTTLFHSLKDAGFNRFGDVVLVMSQSSAQVGPRRVNVREILPEAPEAEICLVEMEMNNFDYSGYQALHMYIDDPMIRDEGYMYILDTSTADPDFPEKYATLSPSKSSVTTCHHPHSNICVFDREVILNYGDNFSIPLTKGEAIHLEFGELHKEGRHVKGITAFGNFISIGHRVMLETFDIYSTGHPRVRAHYPSFGINKWILWGRNGDFTGEVRPN